MPGRPRKPTKLKALQGTLKKSRINHKEPKPENLSDLSAPEWLSPDAKAIWDVRASKLEALGLLTELDVDMLAMYCQAYADFIQLMKEIREEGWIIETVSKRGPIRDKNRKCTIANEKWEIIKTSSQRFGFTPADRGKIEAEPKDKGDDFEMALVG